MHKKYLNKNHTYTLFKEIKPPLEIMQACTRVLWKHNENPNSRGAGIDRILRIMGKQ